MPIPIEQKCSRATTNNNNIPYQRNLKKLLFNIFPGPLPSFHKNSAVSIMTKDALVIKTQKVENTITTADKDIIIKKLYPIKVSTGVKIL